MTNINLSDLGRDIKGRDGMILMGGYGMYLSQLIFDLKTHGDWETIVCQIIIFIALFLMREYKKKSSNVSENFSQYDSEAPPASELPNRTEPID